MTTATAKNTRTAARVSRTADPLAETRRFIAGELCSVRDVHLELAAFAGEEIDGGGESDFSYHAAKLLAELRM